MAPFTKKAIVESFLTLCGRKMPDRITVKNIVDDCEINRNTFYYYFQDIYAVIEELFQSAASGINPDTDPNFSLEKWIKKSCESVLKHKKAAINIYVSLGRDRFEQYLFNVTAKGLLEYIRSRAGENPPSENKIENTAKITRFLLYAAFSDWIRNSMSEPLEQFAETLASNIDGIIDYMLFYSEKHK